MRNQRKVIAVTGANGMLGSEFMNALPRAGFKAVPVTRNIADIRDPSSIDMAIGEIKPSAVINCAAYTDVDACESNYETAFAVNATGAGNVAAAAHSHGAVMVQISTDYVFDGKGYTPYKETDDPNPVGVYAQSKKSGEDAVMREAPNSFIIRTAWLYGAGGKNFVDTISRLARERDELSVVDDQFGSPTYAVHLATGISWILYNYLLLNQGRSGIFHITGSGSCNWYEFAEKIIALRSGKATNIVPVSSAEFPRPAPRPGYSILSNEKIFGIFGISLSHWEDALREYIKHSIYPETVLEAV